MDRAFPPTRAAGLDRLCDFSVHAGRDYACGRNVDRGPLGASAVSGLSPYIRRRLVLEGEVAAAAIDVCGASARKFVQEVFWRTYWKGYLEQHPEIWLRYRRDVAAGWHRLAAESGLCRVFSDATEGRTGIECFDAWARELVATNWLHNHVRMWFASIWTFTLRLPWALGADFFARHLIDGDPASNTLSWRWVAGLHTRGKAYVARAENIARYTEGRFNPAGQLDEHPAPLEETLAAARVPAPLPDALPGGEIALLLHDDDCDPASLHLGGAKVVAVAGFAGSGTFAERGTADRVTAFAQDAIRDALHRAQMQFGCEAAYLDPEDLAGWIGRTAPVFTPFAPTGPTAERLSELPVRRLLRPWDRIAWPFATRGYFQLADQIPAILRSVA